MITPTSINLLSLSRSLSLSSLNDVQKNRTSLMLINELKKTKKNGKLYVRMYDEQIAKKRGEKNRSYKK